MDKMAQFEQLLTDALEKFKANGATIEELKSTVETVQRTVTFMKAQADANVDSSEPGFNDPEMAKGFIEFCRAAWLEDKSALASIAEKQGMNEANDPDGGFLVPAEFRPTLVRLVEVFGIARRFATVIPMRRLEMEIPKLTQSVAVFWIDEGQQITETRPQFGNVKLVAKKLAALVPVTGELMEDSTIPIANLIATLFAEQIAFEEDRVVLTGDVAGAGDPFNGVLGDPGTTLVVMGATLDAFADVDADDLADMTTAITRSASTGARWYLHRTVWNLIRKLKGTDGHYIYSQPSGGIPGTIWGFPYELTDVMPSITDSAADTPFIIFGNLRHVYIGDRRRMTMAPSTHVGFTTDQIFLRVIQRTAITVALPEAFAVLKTAA